MTRTASTDIVSPLAHLKRNGRLDHFYIDGQWQRPQGDGVAAVVSPATEERVCEIALGKAADVDQAVQAARMGWGLVYQIHGLSDDEKIAALTQAAEARGLTLSASVLPYLLSHFKRDMRSLSTMLDALDQYSLETQRPVTLPLLRDLLLQGNPGSPHSEPKE